MEQEGTEKKFIPFRFFVTVVKKYWILTLNALCEQRWTLPFPKAWELAGGCCAVASRTAHAK